MSNTFRTNQAYRKLRKKADALIKRHNIQLPQTDQKDLMRLVHELEVMQIELELQNEELNNALKDLEYSRDKHYELYHFAPVALLTVDKKGLIEQVNQSAAELFADSVDYLIRRAFSSLILPDDRGLFFSFLEASALRPSTGSCELRLLNKQNQIVHVALRVAPQLDGHGKFFQWRFGLIDMTDRKQAEAALKSTRDKLAERNQQLARLSTELTLAEQRERQRLATILHDDLQQILAGARLNLDIAQQGASEKNAAMQVAYDLVTHALNTSRTLVTEISPPALHMHGLSEALKWLARWMDQAHNLKIDLHADPLADPVQDELKVLLFQSVRELLFNVKKHADTDHARVDMQLNSGFIVITVSDEGSGVDPGSLFQSSPGAGHSYGLFNIRERLLLLGGDFEMAGRPGAGTTITLKAPIRTTVFDMPPIQEKPAASPLPDWSMAPASKPDGKIRVLVVDDHSVVRNGLSSLLSRHADIHVAGEAADGGQAVEKAARINPDVVLMDISMPVMNGVEATRIIHQRMPHIKILGLSMHDDDEQIQAMRNAGAVGLISKNGSSDVLLSAIRRIGDVS